jgi:hypothetical protein
LARNPNVARLQRPEVSIWLDTLSGQLLDSFGTEREESAEREAA